MLAHFVPNFCKECGKYYSQFFLLLGTIYLFYLPMRLLMNNSKMFQ